MSRRCLLPPRRAPAGVGGLLACVALAGVAAVGSGCRRSQPPPGASSPEVPAGLRSPRAFDVVSGKTRIEGPAGRAVLIDGRPAPALDSTGGGWLETSSLQDGLHDLELVTPPGAGHSNVRVSVVVLNQGSEVFFKDGSEGVLQAPPPFQATSDEGQHLRFHWDMPSGVKRVLALLTWPGDGFDLELALGTGTCPHHGSRLAAQHSLRSPISLTYAPDHGDLAQEQWFAHVRLLNADAVGGRQGKFQVRAFLLR